jgi:hypothetical protein
MLSTETDSRDDLLRCGAALSTVLLECTVAGYATCPLTHLTEFPRSRDLVGGLTGQKLLPQALIRVGTALGTVEAPPTPRLPLDRILQTVRPATAHHPGSHR